jgi:hypothetical protein
VGRESFEKREREKRRQQRSAAKRQRREARAEPDIGGGTVESDELMERFRVLSERYAAGALTREQYEPQRLQIFSELGLDPNARGTSERTEPPQ